MARTKTSQSSIKELSRGSILAGRYEIIEERLKVFKQREPKNTEACIYYMKGKHFDRQYQDSNEPKDFEVAVQNYEKAAEI